MDTKLFIGDATAFATPMLAVFAVDLAAGKDAEPQPALLTSLAAVTSAAQSVLQSGEFKAGLGEIALVHAPQGLQAERLLLVGLGKAKDFSLDRVRKGAGTAVRAAKPRAVRDVAVAFPDVSTFPGEAVAELPTAMAARAIVEGALIAEVDYDT